jgi:hypothetical protein
LGAVPLCADETYKYVTVLLSKMPQVMCTQCLLLGLAQKRCLMADLLSEATGDKELLAENCFLVYLLTLKVFYTLLQAENGLKKSQNDSHL